MNRYLVALTGVLCLAPVVAAAAEEEVSSALERQFRALPKETRRSVGPLFWLHGDESQDRLEMYVDKVAEGGNGCFTPESRPHTDWLGPGWWRDLTVCLNAAKKNDLKMWIFDDVFWPSQSAGNRVPPKYSAKRLDASAIDVEGPRKWEGDGYRGERYIAVVAGRVAAAGGIEGDSLVDLAPYVCDGRLSWQVPAGKWKIMKFSHTQAPRLLQNGQVAVDGASNDCVDWFLETVYQPHYDHFKADFGKTVLGFFYDEPETPGDWGTELNAVLAEWKVDWKKAYVAYKFELSGDEQCAARYQYLDAFAETWGRTMYGRMTRWCQQRGVKSIGHFMEHSYLYVHPEFCAGDMMRLQKYSDMGGIDAVFDQFVMGKREARDHPTWQTPKLASSISHVFGKSDDLAMVEIFGARGQDLTYSEMKWWTDHMQVSGVNFLIPHSFNPRSPYDQDCPPYFYNGGYEPRWPLYRVFADYASRLSLMLTGGRHVCPIALLFGGNTQRVGKAVMPEEMTTALQDAQYDCDWLPFEVFERDASLDEKEIKLYKERYRVVIVPPVEVIPYTTMAKVKEFFDRGGVVVGYGFLPSKSATIGKGHADIVALCREIWGDTVEAGTTACKTNTAGGRSYLISQTPKPVEVAAALAGDAGIHPTMEVLAGQTDNWLHVLHRQREERDVFLICNQNHQGPSRQFKFRATAQGEPECWDAMRNDVTALPYQRIDEKTVEFSLAMEPLESIVVVFQPQRVTRPMRIEPGMKPVRDSIVLTRDPNPTRPEPPAAEPKSSTKADLTGAKSTMSPVAAADPFQAHFAIPSDVSLAKCRVFIEMEDLPDDAATVVVNGKPAGGFIGKPLRLEVTRYLNAGQNTLQIEPLAPGGAKLVFYDAESK